MITALSRLGLSISPDEVLRYKQSCVYDLQTQPQQDVGESFVQWVGDNVDHNVMTLTGKGTFQGMGIISIRDGKNRPTNKRIPRLKDRRLAAFTDSKCGVDILPYYRTGKQLQQQLVITSLDELREVQQITSLHRPHF